MKTLILIALSFLTGLAEARETVATKPAESTPAIAQLVPYDAKQALESFSKTVHGGIMHIVAKSGDNTQQITLIQQIG